VPYSPYATFVAIGTVCWQASYTGDANNGAKTRACEALIIGSSTPMLTLTTSPAGSVAVDGAANGRATLASATSAASGSDSDTVYANNACTVAAVPSTTSTEVVASGIVGPSDDFTFDAIGTSYWRAMYGGDGKNQTISTGCVMLNVVDEAVARLDLIVMPNRIVAGTFYWVATQGGDASNDGDVSACIELTVDRTAPFIVLSVSPDPVVARSGAFGSAALAGATTTAATTGVGGSVIYTV